MKILIVPEINNCARCDGHHGEMVFTPFAGKPISRFGKVTHTHWAVCPTLGEPILLVCTEDHEADPDVPIFQGVSVEVGP